MWSRLARSSMLCSLVEGFRLCCNWQMVVTDLLICLIYLGQHLGLQLTWFLLRSPFSASVLGQVYVQPCGKGHYFSCRSPVSLKWERVRDRWARVCPCTTPYHIHLPNQLLAGTEVSQFVPSATTAAWGLVLITNSLFNITHRGPASLDQTHIHTMFNIFCSTIWKVKCKHQKLHC